MAVLNCLLEFPTAHFGEKADYTNFNRSDWIPRSYSQHRSAALEHKCCMTKSLLGTVERNTGVRYSYSLGATIF